MSSINCHQNRQVNRSILARLFFVKGEIQKLRKYISILLNDSESSQFGLLIYNNYIIAHLFIKI